MTHNVLVTFGDCQEQLSISGNSVTFSQTSFMHEDLPALIASDVRARVQKGEYSGTIYWNPENACRSERIPWRLATAEN